MAEQVTNIRHHSGNKYLRLIHPAVPGEGSPIFVDVYCVAAAFEVNDMPLAHAIKKILCAGLRGKASRKQDLSEAIDSISRQIEADEANSKWATVADAAPSVFDAPHPLDGFDIAKERQRMLQELQELGTRGRKVAPPTLIDPMSEHHG